MSREEMIQEIKSIIEEVTDIPQDKISADTALMDELDMSSLEIMAIITEMEEEFKIRIPERKARNFVCINDIVDYIKKNS